VIIRRDLREKGLAGQLIEALTRAIATQGIRRAVMLFPADKTRVINLSKDLGFTISPSPADPSQVRATKPLAQRP
jgi:L-amino acid N-acyltransferase YncA